MSRGSANNLLFLFFFIYSADQCPACAFFFFTKIVLMEQSHIDFEKKYICVLMDYQFIFSYVHEFVARDRLHLYSYSTEINCCH